MKKLTNLVLATTLTIGAVGITNLIQPTQIAEAAYTHEEATTNKSVYQKGETIVVTGSVNPDTYDTSYMRVDLMIGWGEWIDEQFVHIDENGKYRVTFKTNNSFKSSSDYQVHVFHATDGRMWDYSDSFQIR